MAYSQQCLLRNHFHSILKTDKKKVCRLKEWKKLSKRCAGRGGLIWEMPKRTIVLFVNVLPRSVRLIYSLNPKNQMSHVFGNLTKWQMAWALRFLCKECHIFLSWSKIVNLLSKWFNCGVPRCVLEDSSHKGHTPLWSLNRLWNLVWWLDAMMIYGVVFNLCCRIYIGKDIQATIKSHIECQFPMSKVVIHTHKGKDVNPLPSRAWLWGTN